MKMFGSAAASSIRPAVRAFRGCLYRKIPVLGKGSFAKKLAGFERRWNLETKGFTKEQFFEVFRVRFHLDVQKGLLCELVVGDGLVGSLGLWMGRTKSGWRVQAWEHRPHVLAQFRKNRPATEVHPDRLSCWEDVTGRSKVTAVTTRGAREASGVCRGIRKKQIRPSWLGIWNPGRRPVWYRRLRREGYRLELVWHQTEFYRARSS
jgi:hypothetical protein